MNTNIFVKILNQLRLYSCFFTPFTIGFTIKFSIKKFTIDNKIATKNAIKIFSS